MASFSKRLRRVEKDAAESMDALLAAQNELAVKVRRELQQRQTELRELADQFDHLRQGEAQ